MDEDQSIICCPNCKKPVEAIDYLNNAAIVGFLDSVLPTIDCSKCNYKGLPISINVEDYEKFIKN